MTTTAAGPSLDFDELSRVAASQAGLLGFRPAWSAKPQAAERTQTKPFRTTEKPPPRAGIEHLPRRGATRVLRNEAKLGPPRRESLPRARRDDGI